MRHNKLYIGVAVITAFWAGGLHPLLALTPQIESITMKQQVYSRQVEVSYKLVNAPAIVTLAISVDGVMLPESTVRSVSGAAGKVVQPGPDLQTIVWNARKDWPDQEREVVAHLTAWRPDTPPQIMIIDLNTSAGATEYPVHYCTGINTLPFGDISAECYRRQYLVLRKIPAGRFSMGGGLTVDGVNQPDPHSVILTKPFYAGVFEVTQAQWFKVMGENPAWYQGGQHDLRPVEQVTYNQIRGAVSDTPSVEWPTTGTLVSEGTFMHVLRSKTGVSGFDLPTEAQWEYACKAGSITSFNDNQYNAHAQASYSGSNGWLNLLGRYRYNGGRLDAGQGENPPYDVSPELGSNIVGSYAPNAWDLYDMHGNVKELCLDWFDQEYASDNIDPQGVATGTARVFRGGSWVDDAYKCHSTWRGDDTALPDAPFATIGFRVFCNLP